MLLRIAREAHPTHKSIIVSVADKEWILHDHTDREPGRTPVTAIIRWLRGSRNPIDNIAGQWPPVLAFNRTNCLSGGNPRPNLVRAVLLSPSVTPF
ncbi:hypothetical protein PoB_005193300 [Plakobranchus ocellatus]|uniref:Uncharacterized protein n=1 Tax=Plakobranchus ocellatus TaxID=259542 RepID=A0AAV4C1Y2_9GAST|nr:hypothetical protein PoB_005193300 [Plakobranchus ocellatus]